MAFSVRDNATDAAVRRLAKLKRKSLTDTIREAVENEYRRTCETVPLAERLKALGDAFSSYPRTGEAADKDFFDKLGGDL
jgi:antitoxin VapB